MAWTQLEDFRDRPAAEAVPLSKHQDFVVKDKRKNKSFRSHMGALGGANLRFTSPQPDSG